MKDNKDALEAFLLDIDCLEKLDKWTSRVNIFDVLKITNAEIRHSNFLAWLLDPNALHGLAEKVLKKIILEVISNNAPMLENQGVSIFDATLMDYGGFNLLREWKNIDILAISHDERFLICFENKVWSKESPHQLGVYRDKLLALYPGYKMIFVFLTPGGDEASDIENWVTLDYTTVTDIIEQAVRSQASMNPDTSLMIRQYIETVRRHIVGDNELTKLCEAIYRKHKTALDLIYENRPDNVYNITEHIVEYLSRRSAEEKDILFDPVNSTKTMIRFFTPTMEQIIPVDTRLTGGWGNGRTVFYEIINRPNRIAFQIAIASVDTEKAEKLANIVKELESKTNVMKPGWQWKIVKSWPIINIKGKDYNNMDDDELEQLQKELIKGIDRSISRVLSLEKEIIRKWD